MRFHNARAQEWGRIAYPLLVKHLLHTPLAIAPGQEIVHGERRHDYRALHERIGRLAGALWAGAFGLFALVYWPVLTSARIDGQPG